MKVRSKPAYRIQPPGETKGRGHDTTLTWRSIGEGDKEIHLYRKTKLGPMYRRAVTRPEGRLDEIPWAAASQ